MKTWAFAILVMALGGCVGTSPESDPGDEDVGEAEEASVSRTAGPIVAKAGEMAILLAGNFDSSERLRWDDAVTAPLRGGNHFASPYKTQVLAYPFAFTRVNSQGDWLGQPASFIKSLSGRTAPVGTWVRGVRVLQACSIIPAGTAVGTFLAPNNGFRGHVGFLAKCSGGKITLWDQGYASPPDGLVRKHTLVNSASGTPSDAAAYYVVLAPE